MINNQDFQEIDDSSLLIEATLRSVGTVPVLLFKQCRKWKQKNRPDASDNHHTATDAASYAINDIVDGGKEYLAFEKIISFKVIQLA